LDTDRCLVVVLSWFAWLPVRRIGVPLYSCYPYQQCHRRQELSPFGDDLT
jgi:hypothetical protein